MNKILKVTDFAQRGANQNKKSWIDKLLDDGGYLPIYKPPTPELQQIMINRIINLIEVATVNDASTIDLRKTIIAPTFKSWKGKTKHHYVGELGFTGKAVEFSGKVKVFDANNVSIEIDITITTFITGATDLTSELLVANNFYKVRNLQSNVNQPAILQIGDDITGFVMKFNNSTDRSNFINTYLKDDKNKAEQAAKASKKDDK